MDIKTTKGKESAAAARLAVFNTGLPHVFLPDGKVARIDGFFLDKKGMDAVACFEAKARDFTAEKLGTTFKNEWMISSGKLRDMVSVVKLLCIPCFGVLYLRPDDLTLLIKIVDEHGNVVADTREEKGKKTQATCNGGTKIDDVVYINMTSARHYSSRQ